MGLRGGLCNIESNPNAKWVTSHRKRRTQMPTLTQSWCRVVLFTQHEKNTRFIRSVEVGTRQIQKSTQIQANKSRRGAKLHYKTGRTELNPQPWHLSTASHYSTDPQVVTHKEMPPAKRQGKERCEKISLKKPEDCLYTDTHTLRFCQEVVVFIHGRLSDVEFPSTLAHQTFCFAIYFEASLITWKTFFFPPFVPIHLKRKLPRRAASSPVLCALRGKRG